MARKYTRVQEAAESLGLTLKQIKQLITRENHRRAKVEAGIVIRPKGRPRKTAQSETAKHEQEVKELRMTAELLRNFLYEAGRR